MKTKKILSSGVGVALALTITSITSQSWPSYSLSTAKADFGDTQASENTKTELQKIINQILEDRNITNRYLGTSFYHKTSNFPYYHVSFENHSTPDDVIDTTPWYNMWSEAATAKVKLEANSYTEKTAKNAINTLKYYIDLYNFDISHDLPSDGFFKITDFKTPSMVNIASDGEQDFYKKVVDHKEEIKNLFKESLIGIYKKGQDIEINLVANPDKISKITSFNVNKISSISPSVNIGPNPQEQRLVSFSVPGELKAEQLVITNMTYLDQSGIKQETGPFALDINYNSAVLDEEGIPKYRENLNEKIQNWIDRGNKVNEWLLTKENNDDNIADFSQRETIKKAVTNLQNLKLSNNANYDKLYEIATPIHEAEDIATLREILDIKVAKLLENFDLYTEDVYTKDSISEYRNYIENVPKLKSTKNIKNLVQLIKEFDNASITYLKFNTDELKRIIEIAKTKNISDYEPVTLEKFTQALNHAEDWINQTENYRPQINDTNEQIKNLTNAINNLIKTNGEKGEQVPPKEKIKKEDTIVPYNISAKFVERGSSINARSKYRDLSSLITSAEVHELGNGKNEIILSLTPKLAGGSIDYAIAETFKYNSLGNPDTDALVTDKVTIDGKDYPTKLKLIVDSTKSNINLALLGNFKIKDSFSFNNDGIEIVSEDLDLYLDYSSKVEAEKEDPIKTQLRKHIDYFTSSNVQDNYKAIKDSFKTSFNQLLAQANHLLEKNEVTTEDATQITGKLLEENNKLDKLANLYQALEATKETYENFWKNNTHYTAESKILVKEKLDLLESTITNLDSGDIEGELEEFTNEHDENGTAIVYKRIDELTGKLQHLGDYLRIDTTTLSTEINNAEQALNNTKNNTYKDELRKLISEVKRYIEHSKLTPDSEDTDDQINTDLTEYYIEQLKFTLQNLNSNDKIETTSNKEILSNKIKEATLIKIGKKAPSAFVSLTNELNNAKQILNDESSDEEAYLVAISNLNNAIINFNNSEDLENQTPPTIEESGNSDNAEPSTAKKIQLDGAFKKLDLSGISTMNSVLKTAYLVTENGKNYIELELQPMLDAQNNAIGVLSELTTFDGNTEKQNVEVLSTSSATVTFNSVTKEYQYPTKVRIPVDGQPESIKVNTFASSTVFGDNKHENAAILTLKYPKEVPTISADKKELNALFNATTHKYYETWTSVFRKEDQPQDMAIITDFGNKINIAQNILRNNNATPEEISSAFSNLLDSKNQYDLLIKLRQSNADTVASFNADKEGKNFSDESITEVENYLQEKIDKLEKLVHENPKSSEINALFDNIQSYYNLLRLNTATLKEEVTKVETALTNTSLSDETKNKIHLALEEAKDFINKANQTRNLEDKRDELIVTLEKMLKGAAVEANSIKPESNNTEVEGSTPSSNDNNEKEDNKENASTEENNKESETADIPNTMPTTNTEENRVDKTSLLIPLEAAKIIISEDELNPKINIEILNNYKKIVEKAQKIYDNPSASQDEVTKTTLELGEALSNYLKEKQSTPNETTNNENPNPTPPTSEPNASEVEPENPATSTSENAENNKPDNTEHTTLPNNDKDTTNNENSENGAKEEVQSSDNSTSNINTSHNPSSNNTDTNVVKQVFFDDNNEVKVELFDNNIASKLSVKEIKDKKLLQTVSEKLSLSSNNKIRILDITLLNEKNEVIHSNAKRTVAIVLKDDEKDVSTYHIKDNGELELINSTIKDNTVTFEIDHFSKFVIVTKEQKTNTHMKDTVKDTTPLNNSTKNVAKNNAENATPKTLSKTGIQNTNLQYLGIATLIGGSLLIFFKQRKKRKK